MIVLCEWFQRLTIFCIPALCTLSSGQIYFWEEKLNLILKIFEWVQAMIFLAAFKGMKLLVEQHNSYCTV